MRLITYARTYLLTQPDGNLQSPPLLTKDMLAVNLPLMSPEEKGAEHKRLKERHGISLHDSVINTDLK